LNVVAGWIGTVTIEQARRDSRAGEAKGTPSGTRLQTGDGVPVQGR
jgi:hypothetical protein